MTDDSVGVSVSEFSPLPEGCPELCPTADPVRDQPLEDHLNRVPTLDRTQLVLLKRVMEAPSPLDPNSVLGLSDLLRRRLNYSHALHPRVIQLLSPANVDPTLRHVAEAVDERIDYSAYQYPAYVVEHRDEIEEETPLCPSEYNIDVLDAIRDLRANNILTSIRRRDQSVLDVPTLARTTERIEREGAVVEGVVTLVMDTAGDQSNRSVLIIDDRDTTLGRCSTEQLESLCETVRTRFLTSLVIQTTSESSCTKT